MPGDKHSPLLIKLSLCLCYHVLPISWHITCLIIYWPKLAKLILIEIYDIDYKLHENVTRSYTLFLQNGTIPYLKMCHSVCYKMHQASKDGKFITKSGSYFKTVFIAKLEIKNVSSNFRYYTFKLLELRINRNF